MQRKLSNPKAAWLVRLLPVLLILGACATGTIREQILTLPVIEGACYVGQETCAECHEDKAETMMSNVHGRLADFELMGIQQSCESCHGPGSLHVEGGGDTSKILNPKNLDSSELAAVCTKCHSSGKTMEWVFSEHALGDVSCADCHVMHPEGKAIAGYLKKDGADLCYSCHQEYQAKANFPSHHPVKEGKMTCNSCHNPHGKLETEEQTRDLCLECHARYQGPFVFEHAPVEEDCMICHDPHGTVANNLLKQNEPFLCLQCHESHFHTTRIGATVDPGQVAFSAYDSEGNINPIPSGTTGAASADQTVGVDNSLGEHSWQMAFGTKCTVCHGVVHGSDLPSQTAPTVVPADATSIGSGSGDGQGWPDGGFGLTR